jgi:hypothetical protein
VAPPSQRRPRGASDWSPATADSAPEGRRTLRDSRHRGVTVPPGRARGARPAGGDVARPATVREWVGSKPSVESPARGSDWRVRKQGASVQTTWLRLVEHVADLRAPSTSRSGCRPPRRGRVCTSSGRAGASSSWTWVRTAPGAAASGTRTRAGRPRGVRAAAGPPVTGPTLPGRPPRPAPAVARTAGRVPSGELSEHQRSPRPWSSGRRRALRGRTTHVDHQAPCTSAARTAHRRRGMPPGPPALASAVRAALAVCAPWRAERADSGSEP